MHHRSSCGHQRIAETDIAAVDACGCGVLQLHLGTFSVRFTASALAKLYQTLSQALVQLEASSQEARPIGRSCDEESLLLATKSKRGAA